MAMQRNASAVRGRLRLTAVASRVRGNAILLTPPSHEMPASASPSIEAILAIYDERYFRFEENVCRRIQHGMACSSRRRA